MGAWLRLPLGLIVGAVAGAAALSIVYTRTAALDFEMDRSPTPAIGGLYDVERVGQDTYAWSGAEATLSLPGLDRRVPWTCTIRIKPGRPAAEPAPVVTTTVDGVVVDRRQTTPEEQDLSVTAPPQPDRPGLVVGLAVSPTFVPGPQDRRALGVMVERWACAPDAHGRVAPPRPASRAAALAGAIFGGALGVLAATTAGALAGAVLVAVLQAVPLATGAAMFTAYPARLPWLAVWIAGLTVAGVLAAERVRRRRWHGAARFVTAFTAAVLYLKLAALLHPDKPLVDALFHAHRLEYVLAGHFYFTQQMPGGVEFPYAIGLYLFAAPWSVLTRDHVLLLRIVVSASEAASGLLLYLMVSRVWQDRLAGAAAAVLVTLVPRSFEIVGNANMTNAFGQAVSLAAVAAAVLWPLGRRAWAQLAGLTAVITFGLLCHVSTCALLAAIMGALAVLYWLAPKASLRAPAGAIVVATAAAVVLAVALYYGHFAAAYRSARRVEAPVAAAAPGAAPAAVAPGAVGDSLTAKVPQALELSEQAVGWPLLLLAIPGVIWIWRRRTPDRLSLAVAAWLLTWAAATLVVVLLPVRQSFQRYAAEFITRVTLATNPAIVVLAAAGLAWAWRRGALWRVAAVPVGAAALYVGVALWIGWFR